MIPALVLLSQTAAPVPTGDFFSLDEVRKIVQEWKTPERYSVQDADPLNPYQAVQSHEGATWLYTYYKARQPGVRINPTQNPAPQNQTHAAWDKWISETYQNDFHHLRKHAQSINEIFQGYYGPPPPEPERTVKAPAALGGLVGTPPSFAKVIRRQKHNLKLDGYTVTLLDAPDVRNGYPYLRYDKGVAYSGSPVTPAALAKIAKNAGVDPTLLKILQSVSALEGGFDSINTYDTGLVSIGFIQFASLKNGSGTLGQLLKTYKRNHPKAFQADFHRFGIDVTPQGFLVVLDPSTGKEFIGPDAAQKIVQDKRLTAVFQRAGKISEPFQTEQLRLAKSSFDPRYRTFTALVDGTYQQFTVNQIFNSQAGLATVMDRLINTGSIGEVGVAVAAVAAEYQAKSAADLKKLEDAIVRRLTYRRDFLAVAGLTKPDPTPTLVAANNAQPRPSIQGSLQGGNQPFPVMPGFNVDLSPQPGQPQGQPPKGAINGQNPGNSAQQNGEENKEPTKRANPPVKPDSQVGRPITDIGG